jgi:hypothetical protein
LVKKSQRDATRHLNNPKLRKRTKWATSADSTIIKPRFLTYFINFYYI